MKHAGSTPSFAGPGGLPLPGSIAEVGYLRLGCVDQWVLIRGERVSNPILILLHGGPGMSETFLWRHFNATLEKRFTVVYWDQRGAGKSFDRRIPRSSMTVGQFLADLDALVDAVRERLRKDTVTLLGHSWGSVLGALYTARFPEKVAAYVGCAQIGDAQAAESASYAYAVSEARRRRKRRTLAKLHAIGPPPYTADDVWTERTTVQRLDGQLDIGMLRGMGRILADVPEVSVVEFPRIMRALRWSMDAMWPEVSRLNLEALVPELRVPVFFFLGRRDHWVPPATSEAYFDRLVAPSKKLVWFEASGHEMFADEPAKFNRAMLELVRPVVLRAGDRSRGAATAESAASPVAASVDCAERRA